MSMYKIRTCLASSRIEVWRIGVRATRAVVGAGVAPPGVYEPTVRQGLVQCVLCMCTVDVM